jgi:predicted RNA methylase
MIKRKNLVALLEQVPVFQTPDYELEQYKTGADLAASIAFSIENSFGDISNRIIADLGCGTGILSAACVALGAAHVVAVDIDPSALEQAATALEDMGMSDTVDFINADVSTLYQCNSFRVQSQRQIPRTNVIESTALQDQEIISAKLHTNDDSQFSNNQASNGVFDTIVMNPPFGTRRHGIDVAFLRSALSLCSAQGVVYSLHKSSTRAHLAHLAETWNVGCALVAELNFDIPATYAFHKAESLDVKVDLLCFFKGAHPHRKSLLHLSAAKSIESSERDKGKRQKKSALT